MALEETQEVAAVTITCDVYGCKTEPYVSVTYGVSAPRTYAEERVIRAGWRVRTVPHPVVAQIERWACPTHAREETTQTEVSQREGEP